MELASKGSVSDEMQFIAEQEHISLDKLRQRLIDGRIIITKNVERQNVHPIGIGEGLSTKINANIGTSSEI